MHQLSLFKVFHFVTIASASIFFKYVELLLVSVVVLVVSLLLSIAFSWVSTNVLSEIEPSSVEVSNCVSEPIKTKIF